MTYIYFVRHAEPVHSWEDNCTRPLSEEGVEDCKKVTETLRNFHIDYFLSSPFKRSFDTIYEAAKESEKEIFTDPRFQERKKGINGNDHGMFQKRWADFNFCENGGESLGNVQRRNIEVLMEVLSKYANKNIVIGTHGTALSTIINYFQPSFKCEDFLRIIDFMQYILRMDFENKSFIGMKEILIVKKEFKTENNKFRGN